MKRLLLFLSAYALALTIGLQAEPAVEVIQPNIRIELQVVAIPEEIAIPLVAEMKQKDKIEAANARIQELLAKGVAKLVGWPTVTTRSGQRAVSEAINELRYATEYSPPTVGVFPNVPADTTVKIAPTVDVTTFEGLPTAFETRDTGVTLAVEPVLSPDGKTISLDLEPQHVRLQGFNKVTIEGAARKGKVIVEQPQFETHKVTTSLILRNGERVLMGIFPTSEPPKHLEFFILKAEASPVE